MDDCANSEHQQQQAKIKDEEGIDDEIKSFAENTMNELLGWYGYGGKEEVKTGMYACSNNSNSSGPDSPKSSDGCGWCGKIVEENMGITSASAIFCSELCFSQSRRANFKKNKTCDWCRHVRHTVSYVDFQDGASQLQFCSDKCLNQYKMHIFCRETRAHLEMHPHLAGDNSDAALITPDLWMKNCRSSHSRIRSPSPHNLSINNNKTTSTIEQPAPQTSPLPLLTLAHPSKLLASKNETEKRLRKMPKKSRKRSSTITCSKIHNAIQQQENSTTLPQDLRVKHSLNSQDFLTSSLSHTELPEVQNEQQQHKEQTKLEDKQKSNLLLPPVTVLVPYPILLPVPIPIPIPLPISSFLKAYNLSATTTTTTTTKSTNLGEEFGDSSKKPAAFSPSSPLHLNHSSCEEGKEENGDGKEDKEDVKECDLTLLAKENVQNLHKVIEKSEEDVKPPSLNLQEKSPRKRKKAQEAKISPKTKKTLSV